MDIFVRRYQIRADSGIAPDMSMEGSGEPLVVVERAAPGGGTVPGSATPIGLYVGSEFKPFPRFAEWYAERMASDSMGGQWEPLQARLELEGMPSAAQRRRRAFRVVVDVFADDTGNFGRGSLGIAFNEAVDSLLKRPSSIAVNMDAMVAKIDDEGPYDADTGEAL